MKQQYSLIAFVVFLSLLVRNNQRQSKKLSASLQSSIIQREKSRRSDGVELVTVEHLSKHVSIKSPTAEFGSKTRSQVTRRGKEKDISYPPLSSLVQEKIIIADVDFLLDFAIAGFAKTGTTTLARRYFEKHPEIAIPHDEIYHLKERKPAEMVRLLHRLNPRKNIKRGYKAPRDIADSRILDMYDKYWPSAKLIVGIRHPVEWFNSFYNYRLRFNISMPPAEYLTGECLFEMPQSERLSLYAQRGTRLDDRGVCANLARYHDHLSLMGKTNISDPAEDSLLWSGRRQRLASRAPIHNQVFLYEVSQLGDNNISRLEIFLHDLQHYLSLRDPFILPSRQQQFDYRKDLFNICDDKYFKLRETLVQNGKEASTWIQDYFMNHPEVTVSSPDHFRELLDRWQVDPCTTRK